MKSLFWRVLIIVTIAAITMVALAVTWDMGYSETKLVLLLFALPVALLVYFWRKL